MNPQTEQAASERFLRDFTRALDAVILTSRPRPGHVEAMFHGVHNYDAPIKPISPLSEHLGRCSSCDMLATLVNGECWACGEGGGK